MQRPSSARRMANKNNSFGSSSPWWTANGSLMDPHNDQVPASNSPEPEADTKPIGESTQAEEIEAPATEPAPIIPEIFFPEDERPSAQTPVADFSTVGTGSVFSIS